MRNFDERMDAIRSRSKARIAKRRKYIAAGTSAFLVCIALTGTLFLPNAAQQTVYATETTVSAGIHYWNTTLYYDTGDIVSISDGGKEILQYIDSLDPYPVHSYITTGAQKTAAEDAIQRITYRFEITDHLGSLRRFTLCGGELTDEDSKIIYALDSEQLQHLLRLLKIIKE